MHVKMDNKTAPKKWSQAEGIKTEVQLKYISPKDGFMSSWVVHSSHKLSVN